MKIPVESRSGWEKTRSVIWWGRKREYGGEEKGVRRGRLESIEDKKGKETREDMAEKRERMEGKRQCIQG